MIRYLNEKHFDPVWHAHSEYQLFVVLEGTGTRFIGDSIKAFKPGELVFTGPNLPHLWRSDEVYFDKRSSLKSKGIVIYLKENFLGDDIVEKEEMAVIKRLFLKSMQGLEFFGPKKEAAIELMQNLTSLKGVESVIHLLLILQTLAGCKKYHCLSTKSYHPSVENETDRLNKVYEYILKNFKRKIALKELADLVHMTPSSFSRYFAMKNNKPLTRFVAEIRIKHACKLLAETDGTVSQVCYECGFDTLSNFNKQFKDIMLKKPMDYKKEVVGI